MDIRIDHISIKLDRPGFDPFFGSRLVRGKHTLLMDVGPANTARKLIEALENLGVERLDYILLSHIHIDHAGSLAEILERWPEAAAVCHGAGLPNLIDPSKLWSGSLKVLGDLSEVYGCPKPSPAQRLRSHLDFQLPGLTILETPGHALHHLSYVYEGRLFSGESGGNYFRIGQRDYLRPATPPRFFLKEALDSVDRMLKLPDMPIFYAHFDQAEHSHRLLKRFREQLIRWADLISMQMVLQPDTEGLEARCIEALIAKDPELKAFADMDPATQARERRFIANSVRGYLGLLGKKQE